MTTSHRGWFVSTLLLALGLYLARTWPLAINLQTHVPTSVTTAEILRRPLSDNDQVTWRQITRNDQSLSIWQAAQNARALLELEPGRLLAQRQCYPMPKSGTLGEHEIEFGILSVPWLLASGDPVVSYNLALMLTVVLAAAGMFLFVRRWTGSVPAASAAAIAFALSPVRLPDAVVHPPVEGLHWIPVVLWAVDAAIDRGELRHYAMASFGLVMGSLVGGYPLVTLAAVAGPYALVRIAGNLRTNAGTVVFLTCAAVPALVVVAAILRSFGVTAETWVVEGSRTVELAERTDFLPGGPFFPGFAAMIGLLFVRARSLRPVMIGLGLAALAVFVLCSEGPLWPGGPNVPAFYTFLAERFPILLAVRAPVRVAAGASIALLALGMIGCGTLLARLQPALQLAAGVVLIVTAAGEFLVPSFARWSYGPLLGLELVRIAPEPDVVRALASLAQIPDERAVLDAPPGRMMRSGSALIFAAYHGKPTSACYQSLTPVSEWESDLLFRRMSSASGVLELAAAGFGHVIVHRSEPSGLANYRGQAPPEPAQRVFDSGAIEIFELPQSSASKSEPGVLRATEVEEGPPLSRGSRRRALLVTFENTSDEMWSLARPPEPLGAEVTFQASGSPDSFVTKGRLLPPMAVAARAGRSAMLAVESSPPPGEYAVTVVLDEWKQSVANPSLRWTATAGH